MQPIPSSSQRRRWLSKQQQCQHQQLRPHSNDAPSFHSCLSSASSKPLHIFNSRPLSQQAPLPKPLFHPFSSSISSRPFFRTLLTACLSHLSLLLLLLLLLPPIQGVQAQSCANLNSGDDSTLSVSIYNSNGLCQQHCQGYAYAIVQGKQCWCSNYSPPASGKLSSSSCSDGCPVSLVLNCLFTIFDCLLTYFFFRVTQTINAGMWKITTFTTFCFRRLRALFQSPIQKPHQLNQHHRLNLQLLKRSNSKLLLPQLHSKRLVLQ